MEYITVNSKDNTLIPELQEAYKTATFTQALQSHLDTGAEVTNIQDGRIMLGNNTFGVSSVFDFAAQTVTDTFE